MDKGNDQSNINLQDKQLLSKAFKAFNDSIAKLREYQTKLEAQIQTLKVELEHKNQELTNVLQSLSHGLIVTDLEGRVRTFNRAATALTGIPKDEALGHGINELLRQPILAPTLDEEALEALDQNLALEFSYQRGGETVILEISTTLMLSDDKQRQGVIFNLHDVTLLKRLKEEAERKNRLTAMGEIAMQVAHEVRNPLGSIELFVSMMKRDFEEDSSERDLIEHILSATRSMNHIINNLLEYTRPKPIHLEHINLHGLLAEFVEFSRHFGHSQGIELHYESQAQHPLVTGNKELLKQVFLNIFMNATQAMEEGGDFYVTLENRLEADPLILERFSKTRLPKSGKLPLVAVRMRDTGRGMTEEVKRRLFDPFFTTREQGTGLGMSIVFKTMNSHGGTILVDSELGRGTEITLLIPEALD